MPCRYDGEVFPHEGARKHPLGMCISGNISNQKWRTTKKNGRSWLFLVEGIKISLLGFDPKLFGFLFRTVHTFNRQIQSQFSSLD